MYKLESQCGKRLPKELLSSKDMCIMDIYHYLLNEISDPRVSNWFLMSNPFGIGLILLAYLSFVLYLGPLYMKNRQPYALTRIMICYNIFVATANAIVFYGLLSSGYMTHLSLGCEPFVISDDPMSLSMARWVWWVLILKIIELADTVIFILRKKYNQTSFLHVHHHTSTLLMAWISCKYAPGGMWTFVMLPNCAVHVVMYIYYLCACLGPRVQKIITPWKKYITLLQLIQFSIMLVHTIQALLPSCEPTRKPLAYIYMSQIVFMFYMFLAYYRKSYMRKKIE
ncbi:elongation of very long chain fatty acids protein AAEL008004-like [Pseudomyrmex gracilis]|uniref:elongation of very long chain fatty acids protein AAEL008004-like n=1 Tax=Pseudomyrmex gracilis TaxID=219809 RepID=UPI000994DD61|nr:elongation of very long chain fatty acids protein AAEL008004-like [Pseudomyrmex gracilis]